ncbi:uncharacterized protein BDV17DRAFT_293115 [Aspergillus undulatus]|uniref:uncharacterized protein n=1 Tax=Aspergillus undulatus TaxID=1810928 RepID=UPI003CCD9B2B
MGFSTRRRGKSQGSISSEFEFAAEDAATIGAVIDPTNRSILPGHLRKPPEKTTRSQESSGDHHSDKNSSSTSALPAPAPASAPGLLEPPNLGPVPSTSSAGASHPHKKQLTRGIDELMNISIDRSWSSSISKLKAQAAHVGLDLPTMPIASGRLSEPELAVMGDYAAIIWNCILKALKKLGRCRRSRRRVTIFWDALTSTAPNRRKVRMDAESGLREALDLIRSYGGPEISLDAAYLALQTYSHRNQAFHRKACAESEDLEVLREDKEKLRRRFHGTVAYLTKLEEIMDLFPEAKQFKNECWIGI